MAIVEEEVRNDSEEENEIEVVVEDEDGEPDSDEDSEDDEEEALETKVAELEKRIAEDPYNYDDHIELIQALWGLSELERWRAAFDHLHHLSLVKPEHWLERLQTEVSLAHSEDARLRITELFHQASLDCYSVPIFSEWCSWCLTACSVADARDQLDEVLQRAGSDPLSGNIFWDAKIELEKSQLENLEKTDPDYTEQSERLLSFLEKALSRPIRRSTDLWSLFQRIATEIKDEEFVDEVKKQYEAATELLEKMTPFEDKLLMTEDPEEKCKVYQEYIDLVKQLAKERKYEDCDTDGILIVLYDRASTECLSTNDGPAFLLSFASHAHSRVTPCEHWRVLCACVRRAPTKSTFYERQMRFREGEGANYEQIKAILESALLKGLESYKDAENIWMAYLEYLRRDTDFQDDTQVERLRRNFRLAWDSLAEAWGDEANDCEVPLYWARLEYKLMDNPKQGKEIFEEIFKYGENKSMSKYWETLIQLESNRSPPPSPNKLRELIRRAIRFVNDYPPSVVRLYVDRERDYGTLETLKQCLDECEDKIKRWRESYQAMKDKMTGQKNKSKNQQQNKKGKVDKKSNKEERQSKRKIEDTGEGSNVKKKRDNNMDVDEKATETSSSLKRTHEDGDSEATEEKRQKTQHSEDSEQHRDSCTLFVSNLEFKVNETNLRKTLSEYGEIVSMRVKAGVKAFGGSICYCQYTSPEAVEKALKHDRLPLDGRPMFFSRYSTKKGKQTFKYPTTAEKNKLFIKNLSYSHCTKEALTKIFAEFGDLDDVRIVTFKDGRPKGLAYVEYKDAKSAAIALEKSQAMLVGDRKIEVAISAPPARDGSLGLPKREITGGMRRTQLSNFIPSVLQKAVTSTSQATTSSTNGDGDKKPLSNSDFRSLLLKK